MSQRRDRSMVRCTNSPSSLSCSARCDQGRAGGAHGRVGKKGSEKFEVSRGFAVIKLTMNTPTDPTATSVDTLPLRLPSSALLGRPHRAPERPRSPDHRNEEQISQQHVRIVESECSSLYDRTADLNPKSVGRQQNVSKPGPGETIVPLQKA